MTLFHQVRAADDTWAPYEATGTVFGAINRAELAEAAVPSIRQDRRIWLEEYLASLEDRISAAIDEADSLAKTRDELLPLLMSGKIRVSDAEKVVSDVV